MVQKAFRINKAEELQEALKKATEADGPVVIDCPVDYRENMKLSERMQNLQCD